jgi:hypothetical protein
MATASASAAGASRSGQDRTADRLDRRDLLLLRLELLRGRRGAASGSTGQRTSRKTR